MPQVKKSLLVPFSAQQMYSLVNDIEAYPQFLPWCKGAVIESRNETELQATLQIGKGFINQTICTTNKMIPNKLIKMHYTNGSLQQCAGSWEFLDSDVTHSQIIFDLNYEFKNNFIALSLEPMFNLIMDSLTEAFLKRAQELYAK